MAQLTPAEVYGHHWRSVVRPRILARDGHRCQIRGPGCEVVATDVDHVIPWRAGGALFDDDNLRASCGPCNQRRKLPVVQRRRPSREW